MYTIVKTSFSKDTKYVVNDYLLKPFNLSCLKYLFVQYLPIHCTYWITSFQKVRTMMFSVLINWWLRLMTWKCWLTIYIFSCFLFVYILYCNVFLCLQDYKMCFCPSLKGRFKKRLVKSITFSRLHVGNTFWRLIPVCYI